MPGSDNHPAGNFEEVGARGGKLSGGRKVKMARGDRLPPTQKKGNRWQKI